MEEDFLTLQDAAKHLGKSVQTVRRMIKKGELLAQRIRNPQGFHYVIRPEDLGVSVFSNSTTQNEVEPQVEAKNEVLTNQTQILTSQSEVQPQVKAVFDGVDKKEPVEPQILVNNEKMHHEEKMMLFKIIERLQAQLDSERRKPRTFMAYLMERFF